MSNNNALAAGSLPVWPSETSLLSSMLTVLAPTAATGQLPGRQLRNFSRALSPHAVVAAERVPRRHQRRAIPPVLLHPPAQRVIRVRRRECVRGAVGRL